MINNNIIVNPRFKVGIKRIVKFKQHKQKHLRKYFIYSPTIIKWMNKTLIDLYYKNKSLIEQDEKISGKWINYMKNNGIKKLTDLKTIFCPTYESVQSILNKSADITNGKIIKAYTKLKPMTVKCQHVYKEKSKINYNLRFKYRTKNSWDKYIMKNYNMQKKSLMTIEMYRTMDILNKTLLEFFDKLNQYKPKYLKQLFLFKRSKVLLYPIKLFKIAETNYIDIIRKEWNRIEMNKIQQMINWKKFDYFNSNGTIIITNNDNVKVNIGIENNNNYKLVK